MRDSNELEYLCSDSIRRNGILLLVAGVLAIGWAIVGLGLSLRVDVSQFTLHAMTTVPILMGISLISAGLAKRRGPDRIVVSKQGLLVEKQGEEQLTPWSDLAWAKVESVGMQQQKHLRLYNSQGEVALSLPNAVEDFEELCEVVIEKVGDSQIEVATQVGKSTTRRNAILMLIVGPLLGVAAVFVTLENRKEGEAAALLQTQGQVATAEIVERFTAPNGRTRRLKYRLNADSPEENVEVEPAIWEALAGARQVDVVTVLGRPDISRLVKGQVDNDHGMSSMEKWLIPLAGGLMALFFTVFGLFSWFGWDIEIDDKTKKMRITRYGQRAW